MTNGRHERFKKTVRGSRGGGGGRLKEMHTGVAYMFE